VTGALTKWTLVQYREIEKQGWNGGLLLSKKVKGNVKLGMVAANKHHEGFGPATANYFRKMFGMEEVLL